MVEKWTSTDGNQCFRFQEREAFERPWIIMLIALFLAAGTITEYLVNGSLHSLTLNIIAFVLTFLWWLTMPMKANEVIIENTVHNLMDDILRTDAKAAGTAVVNSYVHYDTKGTYGIITSRCLLTLLDSGQVWEYPIIYHKSTEKENRYYECKREYIISDNSEHIQAIKPKKWQRFMTNFKMPDKIKLWLLILTILTIGGLSFTGVYWAVMRLKHWTLLLLVIYGGCYGITEWGARRWPRKVMKIVKSIVSVPIAIVYVLAKLMQPFMAIFGTYFFVALFAFGIPALILKGGAILEWWMPKPETVLFIMLALGSVLCSTHSVTKWIIKHSPLKDTGNHEYEKHREQLAYYLIHPSNIIFFIYLLYFVFLVISGYRLIQCNAYLLSESFDMAILKAFLVFIAYTNMWVKAKNTEIDAKELLRRISRLFVHDRLE